MNPDTFTECFAVPGEHNIIDAVNPDTGLSWIEAENLEQIQARYPGAVRMDLDAWIADKAERQNTPIAWDAVTEEEYYRLFECLPPEAYRATGFLVGEPDDHCARTGKPRFMAYRMRGKVCERASRPMTIAEFQGLMS